MKKLQSLTAFALLAPAMTFGVGGAIAQTHSSGAESAQQQQQRTQSEQNWGLKTGDRAQEAAERVKEKVESQDTFLLTQPANAFRADQVIGKDLKSSSEHESIGTISDLLIDEDGKIVAVMLELGGFLGMGTKDVAIAWDAIEHSLSEDGDSHQFAVDVTKDELRTAPHYKKDRSSDERSTQSRTTQSGETQSGATQSGATQSGATQSGETQSIATQSGETQSAQRERTSQQSNTGSSSPATAQRPGDQRPDGMQQASRKTGEQLSKAPANAFHADSLLGKDVRSQVGDDNAGTISDFVIDENGQVVAVIVGVGGLLGIGERSVAIAWDSLTHSRDEDGDSKITTDMTRESLRDAPDYDRDATTPSTSSTERSTGQTEPLSNY